MELNRDLLRIYSEHPLSAKTILARIERHRHSHEQLSEWDLAIDPVEDITDQNHSGGVQSVLELASAASVTSASTVLDIGAGLGGSARVLANVFNCQVTGIEQDEQRHRDATELTNRVRLNHLVTFRHQDALLHGPDIHDVDVLWGQASWVHFPDPDAFLEKWLPALKHGGRVGMTDAYVARTPADSKEEQLVSKLNLLWGAYLVPADNWIMSLEEKDCVVTHFQERTEEAVASYLTLIRVAEQWPSNTLTASEREAWSIALQAFDSRLIKSYRIVARRL